MKFSELHRLQRKEGITVLSADERIEQLEARLRAVTKERDEFKRACFAHISDNALMQAKIEQMERQEPAGTLHDDGCFVWRETAPHQSNYAGWKMALYALPGAQPAPSFADAYQGAMEEVAIWKKRALEAEDLNRKFTAEINGPTYMGEPAQPAPSEPEGWKLVPIEPTEKMINEGTCASTLPGPRYIDSACAKQCWTNMLSAAPETKP